jgi:hypothetical protein
MAGQRRIPLELQGDESDGLRVLATMLGPSDESFRQAFMAVNFVRAREWDRSGPPVLMDRDLISALLDAPSFAEMSATTGTRTKDGIVAGYVLTSLFMMWKFPEILGSRSLGGASLNKAFHACVYLSKELDWKFGDGTALPVETKIKECWSKYKSVAHFWAAYSWHAAFPLSVGSSIFKEDLPAFLSASRYFEMFGQEPILDKRSSKNMESAQPFEIWQVPESVRAILPFDDNPKVYTDSPFAIALRTYAAK